MDELQEYINNIATRCTKSIDEVGALISTLRQHYTMNYIKIMYSWYGYGMLERLCVERNIA